VQSGHAASVAPSKRNPAAVRRLSRQATTFARALICFRHEHLAPQQPPCNTPGRRFASKPIDSRTPNLRSGATTELDIVHDLVDAVLASGRASASEGSTNMARPEVGDRRSGDAVGRERRFALAGAWASPPTWLALSGSSGDPRAGETAAQSQMEQSVDVGDALLQLVRSEQARAFDLGDGSSRIAKERRSWRDR
jgi:hypothetical protein